MSKCTTRDSKAVLKCDICGKPACWACSTDERNNDSVNGISYQSCSFCRGSIAKKIMLRYSLCNSIITLREFVKENNYIDVSYIAEPGDERLDVYDGKYSLIHNKGKLRALRYDQEWRDLTGDGMVFAMFCRIKELEEKLK